MRAKLKSYKVILQITEDSIKVIKILKDKEKKEIVFLEQEGISPGTDDNQISEKLNQILKKLKITKEPIIVSLPRVFATLRYLKIPSKDPQEIERIISLQASRYLPYPIEELITGHSIIRTDKEGYSHINLAIIHQDVVNRLVYKILKDWKDKIETVVLSSYGLCKWYKYNKTKPDLEPAMIIDIDSLFTPLDSKHLTGFTEIAIVLEDNLLFSRAFRLSQDERDFRIRLIEEINRTKDAYKKEAIDKEPKKIILTRKIKEDLEETIKKEISLPIERIPELKDASKDILSRLAEAKGSFANLIGLGLEKIEDSLNLLPKKEKERKRKLSLKKERIKLGLLSLGCLIIFSLGLIKTFHNKTTYLNRLKSELNRISVEAKAIDEMKRKSEVLRIQAQDTIKTADVLYELHLLIPEALSLTTLIYEEDDRVILRGQTQDLASIFKSISILEESKIFKSAKVRYATKRKTEAGEVVEFEIICPMKTKLIELK